jgi:4-hydroxy-3-methylbut-2-enyl diphosphate reductase
VLRVNGADELPDDLNGVVGVTAGASAPEELLQAVLVRLAPRDGVEEVTVTDEDEYFPLPRELRELLRAVSAAAGLAGCAPAKATDPGSDSLIDGRHLASGDVLDALANRHHDAGSVRSATEHHPAPNTPPAERRRGSRRDNGA